MEALSKGRSNKLTGQIGEYLVCAELGKRGLIATPFSGNVPAFDILAADHLCRTVPIQVKTSRGDSWPTDARQWLQLSFDTATQAQVNHGPLSIQNPDLIHVFVAVALPHTGKDRFFILTKLQLQGICIESYSAWMNPKAWRRPHNPKSYDCRFKIANLEPYEDNWCIISDRLAATNQPLESAAA